MTPEQLDELNRQHAQLQSAYDTAHAIAEYNRRNLQAMISGDEDPDMIQRVRYQLKEAEYEESATKRGLDASAERLREAA